MISNGSDSSRSQAPSSDTEADIFVRSEKVAIELGLKCRHPLGALQTYRPASIPHFDRCGKCGRQLPAGTLDRMLSLSYGQ
jgi:hypothetical protein